MAKVEIKLNESDLPIAHLDGKPLRQSEPVKALLTLEGPTAAARAEMTYEGIDPYGRILLRFKGGAQANPYDVRDVDLVRGTFGRNG